MSLALAAGGTGGHVFPALAVAEALSGHADLMFLGGNRFEATAVPAAGIELISAEVRGLERSFTPRNLGIPVSVWRASRTFEEAMRDRDVRALLATGGYVAVPAGLAARRMGIPLFLHEQNAHAGLANRFMGRWAETTFTSFPDTEGARKATYVGNPIRSAIAHLDKAAVRAGALERYGLRSDAVTVGIVGGSLGSGPINDAMIGGATAMAAAGVQVLHLAGRRFEADVRARTAELSLPWAVVGFEDDMQWFFGAVDLVVSRASGMVAELTATGTPSILVPGEFGSKGHQAASAQFMEQAGASLVVPEAEIARLGRVVVEVVADPEALDRMSACARVVGRPDAAAVIAKEVLSAAGG